MMIIFLIFLLLFSPALSEASEVSTKAATLAVNQWIQITQPANMSLWWDSTTDNFASYANKMAYDPLAGTSGEGQVFFCGGTHITYKGGRCLVYDIASNSWSKIPLIPGYSETPIEDTSQSSPPYPMQHSYGKNSMDESRGVFYYMDQKTTLWSYSGYRGGNGTTGTWTGHALSTTCNDLTTSEYMPSIDRVVVTLKNGNCAYAFNPANNTWTTRSFPYPTVVMYDGDLFRSPGNDKAYFTGYNSSFYKHDGALNQTTALAPFPTGGGSSEANYIADPNTGIPLFFSGNGNTYALTTDNGSWTPTGAPSHIASSGKSSVIVPLSNYGVIMLVKAENGTSGSVWLYRYSSNTPLSQPPSVAITTPTYNNTPTVSLSGTATDDVAVTSVTWTCATCTSTSGTASGTMNLAKVSWTISSLGLGSGANTINVISHDGDGQTATANVNVTYTPVDSVAPSLTITSPSQGYKSSNQTITISGSASDNVGVTSVTWTCVSCTPASGNATGTTSWSISNVVLTSGANAITVTAHDQVGNSGVGSSQTLNVTYTPATGPQQLPIPSLDDERNTYYTNWNKNCNNCTPNWTPKSPPDFPGGPEYSFTTTPESKPYDGTVNGDPIDIHGNTEGDDLWSNLMQYRRRGDAGYLTRAQRYATFFKNEYCILTPPSGGTTGCEAYGGDHAYGWGLIDWYLYTCATSTCDVDALHAAERIAMEVERIWDPKDPEYYAMLTYPPARTGAGLRRPARHLQLLTRLAEVCAQVSDCASNTNGTRWSNFRDLIWNAINYVPGTNNTQIYYETSGGGWNATYKAWFYDEYDTDFYNLDDHIIAQCTACIGQYYAQGTRLVQPMYVGMMAEAFWQYYRVTGNALAKQRIIDMADFIWTWGIDPVKKQGCITVGVMNGQQFCEYSWRDNYATAGNWDTTYTISYVDTLVYAYKLTGNKDYLDHAKYLFNRGTKGGYGAGAITPTTEWREAADNQVAHFSDTYCGLGATPCGQQDAYHDPRIFHYNKGELQYVYALFENGGQPTVVGQASAPAAPSGFRVQ